MPQAEALSSIIFPSRDFMPFQMSNKIDRTLSLNLGGMTPSSDLQVSSRGFPSHQEPNKVLRYVWQALS